jgi:hypothetical protein
MARKKEDRRKDPPTPKSIRFMMPCFYNEPVALRIVYCMKTFPLRIKLFVQFLIDKVSDSIMCWGEEEKITQIFLGIQRILSHLT